MKIKRMITKSMYKKYFKLLKENASYKWRILDLEEDIKERDNIINELKKVNYEISSNNDYLLEQRKKVNEKNRKLRSENIELKEREKKNERKNKKSVGTPTKRG